MLKLIPALILVSCASVPSNRATLPVTFGDAEALPKGESAHVCVFNANQTMDCVTLDNFMRVLRRQRESQELRDRPTTEL